MSIFQPVILARQADILVILPIASESWSSSTVTSASLVFSLALTEIILAGERALPIRSSGLSDHSIISIFSPPSSEMMVLILTPFCPTHEPTGSIPSCLETTAIFDLGPGFSGDVFYLHRSAGDFRNFQFKQLGDEFRMGTGQKQVYSPVSFFHQEKARLWSFLLFGISLLLSALLWENSRGSSQVHEHIATFYSLDNSAYYFPLAFFEFTVD